MRQDACTRTGPRLIASVTSLALCQAWQERRGRHALFWTQHILNLSEEVTELCKKPRDAAELACSAFARRLLSFQASMSPMSFSCLFPENGSAGSARASTRRQRKARHIPSSLHQINHRHHPQADTTQRDCQPSFRRETCNSNIPISQHCQVPTLAQAKAKLAQPGSRCVHDS